MDLVWRKVAGVWVKNKQWQIRNGCWPNVKSPEVTFFQQPSQRSITEQELAPQRIPQGIPQHIPSSSLSWTLISLLIKQNWCQVWKLSHFPLIILYFTANKPHIAFVFRYNVTIFLLPETFGVSNGYTYYSQLTVFRTYQLKTFHFARL